MNIALFDLGVIVVYMLGILAIGILAVRKVELTGDVYFLAGRALRWPVIGAALFASNISTIHLVGLAEGGYAKGLVVGNFEWMATFTLILLSLVFAPFYLRSRISTLPEFLEKRYSSLARSIMAVMAILSALLIHIGISLYAGSKVFETFFGIDVWLSIGIISAVTAIYTVVGGLRAIVVTETIQTVILLGGAILVTVLAVNRLPEHGVHSWADFNRRIDVQHSAESLEDGRTILSGAHWLLNDSGSLAALGEEFRALGRRLEQAERFDREARGEQALAARAEAAGQLADVLEALRAAGRLRAFRSLAAMRGVVEADTLLAHGQRPTAPPGAPEAFASAIQQASSAAFARAADALETIAAEPESATADLMWHLGLEVKEGQKLDFVAKELERAGHEELAETFADPRRWDRFGAVRADLSRAAADLDAARQVVLETDDMTRYLETAATIRTPRLSMLRTEGPFFWLAILLGYPILGVWYWCSDQVIVQRVLGAKDQSNAQSGALLAGLLKITPVFVMVLPGTVAFVVFRDEIGDDAASALPVMIERLMPPGLLGLMAASLLAALMSTIAAALNSAGTLVARDIVGHFRPQTSDAAQVRIGRIAAVVVMLLAMAWSTQGGRFGTIFEIINKIPALFLAPPITTVFLWGVFWKRGTRQAAVTTLLLGLTVGFVLFLADTGVFGGVEWISDPRRGLGIPFMIQAFLMFCLWSVVFAGISLATPAPEPEQVEGITWPNPLSVIFYGRLRGWHDPRLLTIALLVLMAALYYVFR